MNKKTIKDLELKGKKVLVRVDFNVPIKEGVITDENRIIQALPTINYLVEHGAKVVLFSHLGRVKTEEDKIKNNLAPVAKRLQKLINVDVKFVDETRGAKLEQAIANMKDGEIILVQNTRYEALEGKNDPELAAYWASLGDIFVSDAFGSVHRAHCSTVGIANHLPSAVGFLVEKEIAMLEGAIKEPKRPLIAVLGGAKVSDKIAVINNLLTIADKIIIGGGMAYTFYKAQGLEIGKSLLDEASIDVAKDFLARGKDKIVLPIDCVVADAFSEDANIKVVSVDGIEPDYMGLDIGPKTIELFSEVIKSAKTVIWNGPMGVFEMDTFAKGTIGICEALASSPEIISIIGGGDSAAAAIKFGYANKFTHISTGGGASLELLEGKVLPGIAIIEEK